MIIPPIQLTFLLQSLEGNHGRGESVQAVLMQEDLPLDPDDIGEPMQEEKSECTATTPLVGDASMARQSLPRAITQTDGLTIDSSIKTSVVHDPNDSSIALLNSDGQSLTCVAEVLNHASAQSGVPVVCDHVREERSDIIDLTGEESELTETARCTDQFDDFMDNLDDEEFCTSFSNFDDDDEGEDYRPSEGKEKKEESSGGSDEEDWQGEGVDYVKTVAEMAEEANTIDMFDPKVLGKYHEYKPCGSESPCNE